MSLIVAIITDGSRASDMAIKLTAVDYCVALDQLVVYGLPNLVFVILYSPFHDGIQEHVSPWQEASSESISSATY